MAATMSRMTDYELVQVGLVALALLHQRADAAPVGGEDTQ